MPRQIGSFSHPPFSTSIQPAQVEIYLNESNTWKLHAALTVFLEILELQAAEPMQHCCPRNPVISMNLKPGLSYRLISRT